MKKLLFLAAIPVVAILISFTYSVSDLPLGSALPKADLKMKDISGKEVSFNDAMQQNGLLVMFSCNTCPVVKRHQSRTKEIAQFALENKVGVILLNSNEAYRNRGDGFDDMKEYAMDQGYKWYYVVDKNSVMADEFDAKMTPECYLFNKDGKLVYHGAINDKPRDPDNGTTPYLQNAIKETVNGKEVTVSKSTAFGCSIKREG